MRFKKQKNIEAILDNKIISKKLIIKIKQINSDLVFFYKNNNIIKTLKMKSCLNKTLIISNKCSKSKKVTSNKN